LFGFDRSISGIDESNAGLSVYSCKCGHSNAGLSVYSW